MPVIGIHAHNIDQPWRLGLLTHLFERTLLMGLQRIQVELAIGLAGARCGKYQRDVRVGELPLEHEPGALEVVV